MPCRMLLLLLLLDVVGAADQEAGCRATFQVWRPGQDVLGQIAGLRLSLDNVTAFCRTQTAGTEAKMAERLLSLTNATWRVEREVMALRVQDASTRLEGTRMSTQLSDVRRALDNNNRRIDDLELDLYMFRTKVADAGPRLERKQLGEDEATLLRNNVGDLRAEWLLMKREIDTLKREARRLQSRSGEDGRLAQRVQTAMTSLRSLEQRAGDADLQQRQLNDRLAKVVADVAAVLSSVSALQAESEARGRRLALVQQGNLRMEGLLHRLELDVATLRGRQAGSGTGSGTDSDTGTDSGMAAGSHRENSPGVPPLSADVKARDCHELYERGQRMSGVYHIQPDGWRYLQAVYCLMLNGTGHTLLQRRIDGLLNFNRRWLEYQHGFGNPYGEFWIGNELLHALTARKHHVLRVDLLDWDGNRYFAEYSQFSVADAGQHYRLSVGGYSGDAGDSLSDHDGMAFSTEDADNDRHTRHCAAENQGGWWFHSCFSSHLNGVYHRAWYSLASSSYANGVAWYTVKGSEFYSMKAVTMAIKPKAP